MSSPEPSVWLKEWDDPAFEYQPDLPSASNNRNGWWATAFDDFEAATRYWAVLQASFGMEADEATEWGMRWARDHGYWPEGYRQQPIEKDNFATVKAKLRIEDVADGLTHMRWHGNTGRGQCPIHKGNNASSFVVYTETQSFYCFNCNEGGDVVTLLQRTGMPT